MKKRFFLSNVLCLFLLLATFAQKNEVNGHVVDAKGEPISRATITVKGSNVGTTADEKGHFKIKVTSGAILIVSSVNYLSKEVRADGSSLTIALASSNQELSEVIVTALGVRKEKKALTYAVTQVAGSSLTEARTVNVANSLEGRVAGLNIAASATGPQGASRITIRGNGSLSGNNQPLLVVDGIPYNNENINTQTAGGSAVGQWGGSDLGDGISSLNPDDIESVSILKGGTAAALYGSRASNGAILVTTKSGKKSDAIGVDVNSNFQLDNLLNPTFSDYQYQYGAGGIINGSLQGQKPIAANPQIGDQTDSYGALLDGSPVVQFDGVSRPYVAQKNNLKDFYNTGTNFTNSVAFSSGSDKFNYRVSLSNVNVHGILPDNTLVRNNYSVNLVGRPSTYFSYVANVKYTTDNSHNPPRVSDSPGNADYSMYTLPTSLSVKTLKDNILTPQNYENVWSNNQYVQNPYYAQQNYKHDITRNRILTSFQPKIDITNWLYVKGILGFDKYTFRNTDITPTGAGYQLGGGYTQQLVDFTESNVGAIIGVNTKLANKLTLDAFVGNNAMKQSIIQNSINGNPFNIPFFYDISNINPASVSTSYGDREKRINSVYASADLAYNNILFLNVTGRKDWFSALTPSSTFTGNVKNSILYPSVGLSFILSDAIKMPKFVNYAKIRAAWAQVGGDTDPYQLSLNYSLQGAAGSAPLAQIGNSAIPNQLLQPYTSTSSEVGLESRFFNSRMGLDVAVYNRKTTNDIVNATVSPSSGYLTGVFNVGEISNKGVELLLSYQIIKSANFMWESSYNLGYNKSLVVQLTPGLNQISFDNPRTRNISVVAEVGKPYAELQTNSANFARNSSGQIINDASTGLPLTSGASKDMGTGVSPWTMGWSNSFHYKRVAINILIDAKYGGVIFDGTEALAYRYGLAKGTLPGRVTGIVAPGVTNASGGMTTNTIILPAQTYYTNLYNFAEPFVHSSDFIKLRSVSLDYNIPSKVFGKTPFKAVTISLVGRNLWTIMKHTPIIDPESTYNNSNAQGLEFASTPLTRSYGVNLSLKF